MIIIQFFETRNTSQKAEKVTLFQKYLSFSCIFCSFFCQKHKFELQDISCHAHWRDKIKLDCSFKIPLRLGKSWLTLSAQKMVFLCDTIMHNLFIYSQIFKD